jgi:hypothetical protein
MTLFFTVFPILVESATTYTATRHTSSTTQRQKNPPSDELGGVVWEKGNNDTHNIRYEFLMRKGCICVALPLTRAYALMGNEKETPHD